MSLTPDDVLKAARLARLAIGDDEVAVMVPRLNQVMALFDAMQSVDTAGIEPMAHALEGRGDGSGASQRLRPDDVTEADRRADYQSGAPAVEEGLYLVPKVVE